MTTAVGAVRRYGTQRLELGEGARWYEGSLWLVDLLAGRLLVTSPVAGGRLREVCRIAETLGAVAPVAASAGSSASWLAAAGDGVALISPTGALQWLHRLQRRDSLPIRMNDAAVDPSGRFWVGSMAVDATPDVGSLYRLDHDGQLCAVLDGLTIPNGPAFSADGRRMYLADSARGRIDRFEVDPSDGRIMSRTTFAQLSEENACPDGMVVDGEGHLWVAIWGGSAVHRYRPDGELDAVLAVPARQPTSVCFGGIDGSRLFITSGYVGLAEPTGQDGGLFVTDTQVAGAPACAAVLR